MNYTTLHLIWLCFSNKPALVVPLNSEQSEKCSQEKDKKAKVNTKPLSAV
jgi:hypothetical protein